jgi:hypothetical protein
VRYIVVQLYQPVPLTCIQSVQLPCNQSVPEMNMYLQKYNRYMTCSDADHICTGPICYVQALSVMRESMENTCVVLVCRNLCKPNETQSLICTRIFFFFVTKFLKKVHLFLKEKM